ncbi:transposase domain-containing protein, partial [Mesorhizobium sp. M0085]|uniref:transposase domain-containing protein n=1 Tax=Mesorhizobium sp. M0085 TaxID=2956872 RepID=UPI0033389B17
MLSIIETCKLCGVDAEAYMADVTERIQNDWPASSPGPPVPDPVASLDPNLYRPKKPRPEEVTLQREIVSV